MKIIRVADNKMLKKEASPFETKEASPFGWFKQEDAPAPKTKEDLLIDHFNNHIKPKVVEEMKRVGNLDEYSPNVSHYKYLIGAIKRSLREMFNTYNKSKHWSDNPMEKQIVQKILLEDPERSLSSFASSLEGYLQEALMAKDSQDPIKYKMSLKTYHDALHRLYSLLFEYAENYFSAIGRGDAIPKK